MPRKPKAPNADPAIKAAGDAARDEIRSLASRASAKVRAREFETPDGEAPTARTAAATLAITKFSVALCSVICERIANGESLRQICEDAEMPHRITVMRWLGDNDAFATEYARAREMQGDAMDDLILETAMACTEATAKSDRVKILAYQWRAAKLKPKVYGDMLQIQQEVKFGLISDRPMTEDEWAASLKRVGP